MILNHFFTSFRIFLYLGIALIVLAVAIFPLKLPIQAQPGDVDYFGIGWLFTPIIGIWGLASAVLGLIQSSLPKRKIESYLLPILILVSVSLAYATYLGGVFASGIISSLGRGDPFFLFYFALVLAPSLLIYTSAIKFLSSRDKVEFLTNKKVRAATFVILAAVPLLYTTVFLLLIYLL